MNLISLKTRSFEYIMGFIAGFLIMFAIWTCTNPLQADITSSNIGKYQMTMDFVSNSEAVDATSSYFYVGILDTETGVYN